MQDVLRDFALMQIQKQRFCSRLVRYLMDDHGIEQDSTARNPCFVYACYYCRHVEACTAGESDLLLSPSRRYVNWLLRNRLISSALMAAAIEAPIQLG